MLLANWRLINELLGMVDAVLEIVDIRDPFSTRSKKLERSAELHGLPLIIVLNKADLVPKSVSSSWKKYFRVKEGVPAVYISARHRLGTKVLRIKLREVVNKLPLSAGVFGVPKVGKSTLINTLKGRHSAPTSPYPGTPGYTTRAQVFRLGGYVFLVDTPGIVPPEGVGIEAKIRSSPVDKLRNPVAIALELIQRVLDQNELAFKEAYSIKAVKPEEILKELAFKAGLIYGKDKEPNLQEAAKKVIRDYLNGIVPFYVKPPQL